MVKDQVTEGRSEYVEHSVKDGARTINFKGELLATSSSKRPGTHRWVEFELYRTVGGSYVLGRTGVSSLFHDEACAVVARNDLKPGTPGPDAVACDLCNPGMTGSVCLERSRHWAQVSESPGAVLEALYKYDDDGTRYLTRVAQRLIERAAKSDKGIQDAYSVEHVH